jgi:type I restriction enzyme S subunit
MSLPVPLPNLSEQQKIADCLTSLDDLIAAQSQKVEALQAYKKGLMQNLFPAEGETVPRLRFPEFQSAGEWEEKTLGETATFYNGRAYKQEELLEQGKYRVLRVGNFFTNNNWYYSDLELDETKYCENGDLLYAWSASFGPRIWQGEKVIYHYHIWKVVAEKNINKDFLHLVLDFETEKIRSQSANGLGLLHITKGTIENWKCLFPKDPNEQQRIAELLSVLDEQISAQGETVAALKVHKKGLMQGLFPSMDEVQE